MNKNVSNTHIVGKQARTPNVIDLQLKNPQNVRMQKCFNMMGQGTRNPHVMGKTMHNPEIVGKKVSNTHAVNLQANRNVREAIYILNVTRTSNQFVRDQQAMSHHTVRKQRVNPHKVGNLINRPKVMQK